MLHFDEKTIKSKEQDLKINPSEKWSYRKYIPIQKMLSTHHHIPLQHTYKNMVADIVKSEKIAQFYVGHMSYPVLNHNKTFKYQVKKDLKILQANNGYHQKVLKKDNTRVIALMAFY